MALKRKAYAGTTEALAERQVRVICSTADVDRAGEVVVQEGIDLDAYRANPVVLWQHDPEKPIARTIEIGLRDGRLEALVQFPPEGASALADETYALIKAGIINATSIGLDPIETEPMEEARPKGPQRYLKCALWELSFVSVPANPEAIVVQRQQRARRTQAAAPVIRSLYDLGCLARCMEDLGYCQSSAAWEAEIERDGSKVPAMLGEALRQLGEALVAMTAEEVAEFLADRTEPQDVPAEDAEYVAAGATPAIRKFRAGWRRLAAKPAPVTKTMSDRRRRAADLKVFALG